MSIKKLGALALVVLGLAACGSDNASPDRLGTHSTATNPSGNNNNTLKPNAAFSISYQGLRSNVDKGIRDAVKRIGAEGLNPVLKSYTVTVGSQSSSGSALNLSGFPLKKLAPNQNFREAAVVEMGGNDYTVTRSGKAHIYRQNYSLIAGINPTHATVRGQGLNESLPFNEVYILVQGNTTKNLPSAGKYDYSGIASDGTNQGALAYSVDFDTRKGSGKITGIGSEISLNEAGIQADSYTNEVDNSTLSGYGIRGTSNRGDYQLGFFGPNAEEIVGTVNNGEIGFAGSY